MAKNKKQKKNNAIKKEEKKFFLPDGTGKMILGTVMLLMAFIMLLAFFNLAGPAGKILTRLFVFLVGKAVFLIPLWFVLAGLVILNFYRKKKEQNPERMPYIPILLGIFILILGISGILNLLGMLNREGGFLGYLVSWPFLKVFGFWASLIIFSVVSFIGTFIIWQLFKKEKEEDSLPREKEKKQNIAAFLGAKILTKLKTKSVQTSETKETASPKEGQKEAMPSFKIKKVEKSPIFTYKAPPLDILEGDQGKATSGGDIGQNSAIIKRTLENFGIPVDMGEVYVGPTVTQYTLKPAEGIKLSKITTLSDDLSLALAAHPIRIEAPIPGRSLVGIEVPNKVRAQVRLKDLISLPVFQNTNMGIPLVLGRDVAGNPVLSDLKRMPHILIAGSTGTGKTICLNALINSLLYKHGPELLRLILVDPKRVEFTIYASLPHLLCPIIYDAQKSINALRWLVKEMERRFVVLSEAKTRDITLYNELVLKEDDRELLPYIVLVIDELADLMAARGREMEAGIVRLAQMARAVGIHLVLATQRPSVEVITGLIKANITARIAFQVASQVDSRTILDASGAEKLLGLGDLLFISNETGKPRRIQGAYISEKEVKKVAEFFKKEFEERGKLLPQAVLDMENNLAQDLERELESQEFSNSNFGQREGGFNGDFGEDPLFEEAKKLVIESKKASASLLQRRLRLGYARAARLLDILEDKGIVGPADGAKPREVLIDEEGRTVGGLEGMAEEQPSDEIKGAKIENNNAEIDESAQGAAEDKQEDEGWKNV